MPPRRSARSSLNKLAQAEATTPSTTRSFSKPNSNTEDSSRSSPASSVTRNASRDKLGKSDMIYSDSEDELDTLDQPKSSKTNHRPKQEVGHSLSPVIPETDFSDNQSSRSRLSSLAPGDGGGGFTLEIDPPKPKRNSRASGSKAQPRKSKDHFDLSDAFGGRQNGRAHDDGKVDEDDQDQEENGPERDSESSLSDMDFLSGKAEKKAVKKVNPVRGKSKAASRRSSSKKQEEEEDNGDDDESGDHNKAGFPAPKSKVRKTPVSKAKPQPRSYGNRKVNGKGKNAKVEDSLSESDQDQSAEEEGQDSASETEEALLQEAIAASLGKSFDQKQGNSSNTPNSTRSGRVLKAPAQRGVKRSRAEAAGGDESNWDDSSSEDEDFGFTSEDDESHFEDEIPDEGVSEDENIFRESRRASATKGTGGKGRNKSASKSPTKGKGKATPSKIKDTAPLLGGRRRTTLMEYDEKDDEDDDEDEREEKAGSDAEMQSEDNGDDVPLTIKRPSKAASPLSTVSKSVSPLDSDFSDVEGSEDDIPLAKPRSKAAKGGGGFIPDDDEDEEDEAAEVEEDTTNWQQLQQQASSSSQGAFPGSGRALAGANGVGGDAQEEQRYETALQRRRRENREAREARRLAKRGGKALKRLTQYEKTRKALNKNHPELEHVWRDLKAMGVVAPEPLPQPEGLTVKLLPFQREGLGWLVRQEQSHWKGGMLADEMGMGKTIQMISLFLSDRKKPALVIAPTVAIMQWRNEIEKYTKGFKVEMFHGANRSTNAAELAKKDVVLTSYAVLESCFRKQEAGFKRKGQLIKERSVLHSVEWHRIVLDEAHNIKERSTNTAKGAFELKGTYRWCLSGTPLQNRVGELYSMIRFLGGDPYAYYYCKKCDCKSLHWSFPDRRSCAICQHSPMQHVCYWNNEILKPIQKQGMQHGEGKDAFARLRLLLERMMLRRTKLERADDMGLPPRTVEVRRDLFNDEEEDLYKSLYVEGTRKFSTYIDAGTILNNYSNIFTLLTRMRQMANHPDLVLRSKTGTSQGLLGDPSQQGNIMVCRICNEEAEDAIMSKCKHLFCRECVRQYLGDTAGEVGEGPDCPHCHALLSIDLEADALESPDSNVNENPRQGIIGRLNMEKWRSSTKIEALVEELTALRAEDHTIKSLVFSQFVNFLDLVAFRLQRAGFQICRLEGSMSPEARNRTINHFMGNPNITVFLLSLKAGGVALNLTEASRVFILDPWWNPSVEVQAMDRVHRIGQHRPIVVKRMIIENSIESRIIELQVKKSAMIEAAIGKDDAAMGRLTVADLRFLFTL